MSNSSGPTDQTRVVGLVCRPDRTNPLGNFLTWFHFTPACPNLRVPAGSFPHCFLPSLQGLGCYPRTGCSKGWRVKHIRAYCCAAPSLACTSDKHQGQRLAEWMPRLGAAITPWAGTADAQTSPQVPATPPTPAAAGTWAAKPHTVAQLQMPDPNPMHISYASLCFPPWRYSLS